VTRLGVVGHVEWVDFAVVDRLPRPGEILHAREHFAAPGGGGAVAAVQARRLAGAALFLTALGDDDLGDRAQAELRGYGVTVEAARRDRPQRRAFTYLDAAAERTITVLGERIVPHGGDPLPWHELARCDGVYFTGGDPDALRAARAARVLVATPRALDTLRTAGVQLDVLVASAGDPGERVAEGEIDPPPRHVVLTEGRQGGGWEGATRGRWVAADPPGPPVDAYGCGDSFAVGLTYGLGAGWPLDAAVALGARCGAECLAGRGPYGRELRPALTRTRTP
jgi:ribokinase